MIADTVIPFVVLLYMQPESMLDVRWTYRGKLTGQHRYQAS